MSARKSPNGKPRICLVVACSQRKRLPTPPQLQLRSVDSRGAERVVEWNARLGSIEAPRLPAVELYAGGHWHSAIQAYEQANLYSSGAELWAISAGYGLIRADSKVKPYGATFAARAADAVWRGPCDGDRLSQLDRWWDGLPSRTSVSDLIAEPDTVVLIAAGAPYVTTLRKDIAIALESTPDTERLSIVSAGTREANGALPVDGRFRSLVGGTDSSLNTRVLALLSRSAHTHGFRHEAMARYLDDLSSSLPHIERRVRRVVSDEELICRIRDLRLRSPHIQKTAALRELRGSGVACEQTRFGRLFREMDVTDARLDHDAEDSLAAA